MFPVENAGSFSFKTASVIACLHLCKLRRQVFLEKVISNFYKKTNYMISDNPWNTFT